MAFEFDIGHQLWLTRQRFAKLKRDYLPRDGKVGQFLDKCEQIARKESRRGIVTQLPCSWHAERGKWTSGSAGETNYKWGSCMLGFTFRGGGKWSPPTITLHSRASSISDVGAIDLALAWVLANTISQRIDQPVEEFGFRWFADSLQWQTMKGIPYLYANDLIDEIDDEEEFPSSEYPTLRNTRRNLRKLRVGAENGLEPEDEPFGPWKRMRKHWDLQMAGKEPRPSVPVQSLSLEEADIEPQEEAA